MENKNFYQNRNDQYLQFLVRILEKISARKPTKEITSFLFAHQDKINLKLVKIIKYLVPSALAESNPNKSYLIAHDLIIFAELILKNITNHQAHTIEIALTIYQITLDVYTPVKDPQKWAMLQSYLGNMYRDRYFDDPLKNIEQAILHYRLALNIFTKEKYPYRWGIIQRDLGMVYAYNQKPGQDHKLITAITHYKKALKVHNADDFPEDWATNHNNLGEAYFRLKIGNISSNIEIAIEHFQQSLKIYNSINFPYPWSMVNNNLGNAFKFRIKGDRRDNSAKAISYYQKALSIQTLEKYPYNWAMLQNNLAGIYYDLACAENSSNQCNHSDRENLQKAHDCLQNALVIYKKLDFPQKWQNIQDNLASIDRLQNQLKKNNQQNK